jgi:pyruvate/2-oxoglutarate dehydrogenase complex dihydrolipoamide dehydrogenase (E3) component
MEQFDVVVVGAGPAGVAAGVRAGELGARVAVVEAGQVGGTCVNSGCVPTRVLARTARLLRDARDAGRYGVEVGAPRLRWERTVARVREVVAHVSAGKDSAAVLAEAGVTLLREGKARFTGPHELRLEGSGRVLEAGAVLLCVGGHARRLPVPGTELTTTAEHLLDLPAVPATAVVIGSGNTGVQVATVLAAFGTQVTVLETMDRLIPAADHDISRVLATAFAEQGITVRTGIDGITAVEEAGGRRRVRWSAGGQTHALEADAVVVSIGWPGAVEDLGLEQAGVRTERGTIPVNAYLQTNVPHVYAAGDVDGRAQLVQAAESEGVAAATNAVLGPTRSVPHGLLPWGGFTDPDIAGVGLTEAEARGRDPHCLVATVTYSELERARIDGRETGFLKLIADRRRSLLLGAHAAGEGAVEVIQAVTTAMAAGVDVATLARVEFAYPTYTAIVGAAAARLLAEPSVLSPAASPR